MTLFWVVWLVGAAALTGLAMWIGSKLRGSIWAIFIDKRNTWSLSQFQLACWTIVGLPLLIATALWRVTADAATAWDFDVPGELLALMGISVGSAVTALAIKSVKENTRGDELGARLSSGTPLITDMFAIEEGTSALKAFDITKFQNFIITISLLLSYIWIVISAFGDLGSDPPTALPEFSDAMVGLLAISHGGYLVGKLPNRDGNPAPGAAPAPAPAPGRAAPGQPPAPAVPVAAPANPVVSFASLQ